MSEEATLLTQDSAELSEEQSEEQQTGAEEEQMQDKVEEEAEQTTEEAEEVAGAPEEYADFNFDGVEVNEELLGDFKPIAKELNLTQDQAQKLIDLQTKYTKAATESQEKAIAELKETWKTESESDDLIGGSDHQEKVALATKVFGKFGDADFKALLDESGFGNHPAFIRTFYRLGKVISEDEFVEGDEPVKKFRMYPNTDHPS